jgi:hypothetical protein
MSSSFVRAIAVVAALAAPMISSAPVSAAPPINGTAKGKQVIAGFAVFDTLTCADGSKPSMQTFFSILSFETSIRNGGQVTNTLETDIFVSSFNPCTFVGSFSSVQVLGGDLPMNALERATLAGHYVLSDGKVLDLNLTLTGTDSTQQGHSVQRSNFGKIMIITRQNGSFRTAAISGTATYDGRLITSGQMQNTDASLSRNTAGQITVIQSRN